MAFHPQYAGMSQGAPDPAVRDILLHHRRLAVPGLSATPSRPSYRAMVHMRANGYDIVPVNPGCREVLGAACVADLDEAAALGPLEIVNVFRRPEDVPPIAEAAARLGARVLWLQLGIRSDEAATIAREAGMAFVQDRCIKMEHCRFFGGLNVVGLSTGVVSSRRQVVPA
ncbi:MAG: CoA-binding protein [Thermoleophilia bacterium]|nr:CoA-binding protein [Thermoleophilia bacterium]